MMQLNLQMTVLDLTGSGNEVYPILKTRDRKTSIILRREKYCLSP